VNESVEILINGKPIRSRPYVREIFSDGWMDEPCFLSGMSAPTGARRERYVYPGAITVRYEALSVRDAYGQETIIWVRQ